MVTIRDECAELLNTLRMLTLSTVENIVRWREAILLALLVSNTEGEYTQQKNIAFISDEVNYLIKMKDDLNFLIGSGFSKMFKFSKKCDPLLIYPSRKQYAPNNVPIHKKLMKHVKRCEKIILDEKDTDSKSMQKNLSRKYTQKIQRAICAKITSKVTKDLTLEIAVEELENFLHSADLG